MVRDLTSIDFLILDARQESTKFIKLNYKNALVFSDRLKIQAFAMDEASTVPGDVLEFGILGGRSLNFFCDYIKKMKLEKKVFGFDSFKGLGKTNTNINGYNEFDQKGVIPSGISPDAILVVGDITETVPDFAESFKSNISLLHIDTDSYGPAKVILDNLKGKFKPGTLILFDDYHSLVGWENTEHLALTETLNRSEYDYIAFGPHQALIRIK